MNVTLIVISAAATQYMARPQSPDTEYLIDEHTYKNMISFGKRLGSARVLSNWRLHWNATADQKADGVAIRSTERRT